MNLAKLVMRANSNQAIQDPVGAAEGGAPGSTARSDAAGHAHTRTARLASVDLPPLLPDELQRYSRHILIPNVAVTGQRRLKAARVLIVGAGGLGSPIALYLAAAGVGHLGLVDFDVVDVTNLQRQIIHGTSDIGRSKLDSASDRIREVNPHVHVEAYETRLTSANALEIIQEHDVVVDGTDNFQTRYLTNDACVILGKPNIYGSVFRFDGQASVFATEMGPCYRCLFREPPPAGTVPSCAEGGVFGVLPGVIGAIQATEAIKLVVGVGETLIGRLLLVDALGMQVRTVRVRRDPACPACGTHEIRELIDYDAFCGIAPPASGGHMSASSVEIAPRDLAERLARGDALDLIDVREPWEWDLARITGARLIPLGGLGAEARRMDRSREFVVYCHHGSRSAEAARQLRAAGFGRVWNLTGGIERWSRDVDPTVRRY